MHSNQRLITDHP